jgi:APA family basic amino acid/polyamine antiporter
VHAAQTQANVAVATLRRVLGRWDLTAIGVNQVIGGAIFAIPGSVAALSGHWSWLLIIAVGLASLLIAATFAEVSSRFESTGGSYLFTRAAFGRFAAFEVGWMLWFTRVASCAAVVNVLVASAGFYWPAVTTTGIRTLTITAIIAAVALVNIRGIRQSVAVVNGLTIAKMLPLVLFIAVGLPSLDWTRVTPDDAIAFGRLSTAALLLIYAFGGSEVVPVLAGEARNPRNDLPFALLMTIVIVAAVLTLAQLVSLSTLPDVARSTTPIADASMKLMGSGGAALVTIGALISTAGNNMGSVLSGSRNLFALAEQGDLSPFFGRVHPRFRTPANAILITTGVSLVLALSGTFVTLAATSAISRLVVYLATCASALRLRNGARRLYGSAPGGLPSADRYVVMPAAFELPLGPVIPIAAISIALTILAGATRTQLAAGAAALLVGGILFLLAVRSTRSRSA